MRLTARPIEGKPGCVEILVDGKKCEEIRCKSGSARVAGPGMITLAALITCPAEQKKTAKEEKNGNNSGEKGKLEA